MAREKAYGLSKKAPSRIKKKIGRQALRKKKHVSSQQSVVRSPLQVAGGLFSGAGYRLFFRPATFQGALLLTAH